MVVVPAADKLDRSGAASAQYSGGLFEQVVVLTGDALFHALWQRRGDGADLTVSPDGELPQPARWK